MWLERNRRIFHDKRNWAKQVWPRVTSMIHETLMVKCDLSIDIDPGDVQVVQNLMIFGENSRDGLHKRHRVKGR